MPTPKQSKSQPKEKGLHSRNRHRQGYDFPELIKCQPTLAEHVIETVAGDMSIDFSSSHAVKELNAALLEHDYGITHWQLPEGALCPPIPGRVDYIHHMADLLGEKEVTALASSNKKSIRLLDIGTGASGIYALLASQVYGWQSVGSDIAPQSLDNVRHILSHNPALNERISLRLQTEKHHIFEGIIQPGEFFDITVCNPPFHASAEEARKGSQRKVSNLAKNQQRRDSVGNAFTTEDSTDSSLLNFGGIDAELWCNGGERLFLKKLINESKRFSNQCRWFSSLVSKGENVKPAKKWINKYGATEVKEIEMSQGNKITRVLAWTYQ